MSSLFNLILLDSWGSIVTPVCNVHQVMYVLFVALLIICCFGLFNVIIGVIVQKVTSTTNDLRAAQQAEVLKTQARKTISLMNAIAAVFPHFNGTISMDEFKHCGEQKHLQEMLDEIDLPLGFTFVELFQMLDNDGSGKITQDNFVSGMGRLIYNTEFHRDCITNCAFGQIRQAEVETRRELKKIITDTMTQCANDMRNDVRTEIQKLLVDLQRS